MITSTSRWAVMVVKPWSSVGLYKVSLCLAICLFCFSNPL